MGKGAGAGAGNAPHSPSFNVQFLTTMFQLLSQQEENSLRSQKQNMDRKRLSRAPMPTPHDFTEALEQYQVVEHLSEDRIGVFRQGWRERYYHYFFHIKIGHNPHRQSQIEEICHDYLVALHWITRYYFISCPNWTWFYRHEATPLLSDFTQYINSHQQEVNQVQFVSDQPVSPYIQLLMILPPQSADLLPPAYHKYMLSDTSPFISYFPTNIDLEFYGCRFRWEAHPKIPLIDPAELICYIDQQEPLVIE
jgi:5'-3' exonuclease